MLQSAKLAGSGWLVPTVWTARNHNNMCYLLSADSIKTKPVHQSLEIASWTTETQCVFFSEAYRWAKTESDWNMLGNAESFTDQAIHQWWDHFNVSKLEANTWNICCDLLFRNCQLTVTFKLTIPWLWKDWQSLFLFHT